MIPIIDQSLVETVKWETDPDTYDQRLCELGSTYAEFIIINPGCDTWVLDHINTELTSRKCIVWTVGDYWIAKKFHRQWNKNLGWRTVGCVIPTTQIEEWNSQLPSIFSNIEYTVDSNDLLLL
jgi:hypothetical protein